MLPDSLSFLLSSSSRTHFGLCPYTAGSSFTMRTRLWVAAARRKIQSTRRRPRNRVRCSPATPLIQLNTFSIRRRLLCARGISWMLPFARQQPVGPVLRLLILGHQRNHTQPPQPLDELPLLIAGVGR